MPLLHDMMVNQAVISGNTDKYLAATRTSSGTVHASTILSLLNFSGGTLSLATTYTITNATGALAFDPTGKYIAVPPGGASGNVPFALLNHSSGVLSLATTYTLASGGTGSVYWHSVAWTSTGAQIVFSTTATVHALNFNGSTLSLGSVYNFGRSLVQGISKHPTNDNYFVVAISSSPHVAVLNHSAGSLSLASTYVLSGGCNDVDFSPDGSYVACGHALVSRFTLLNHSAGTLSFAATYATGTATLQSVRYIPGGNYIAYTRIASPAVNLISQSGSSLTFSASYTTAASAQYSLEWARSGNYLFTGSGAGVITVLNHSAGALSFASTYTLSTSSLFDMSIHP